MKCEYALDGVPNQFWYYIQCILENTWGLVQMVLIGVAVILTLLLINKTVTNRDNPKVLAEVKMQWVYLTLLYVVVIGGAGVLINMIFSLLGLPSIDSWLKEINESQIFGP